MFAGREREALRVIALGAGVKISVRDIGGSIRLELDAETEEDQRVLGQLMQDLGGSLYAIDTRASFRIESVGGDDLDSHPDVVTSVALEHALS